MQRKYFDFDEKIRISFITAALAVHDRKNIIDKK